jgi:protein-arginine kinase activator protein McsA
MVEKALCKKHGEVNVWIVCQHVGAGKADSVIFSERSDALCFECANNFQDLTEEHIVGMCEECLKDFTAKLMADSQTFANLKNRVVGLEHLKGRKAPMDKEEEK